MRSGGDCLRRREADLEREVEIVEIDEDEYDEMDRDRFLGWPSSGDIERLRPLSAADFANCASATPFLFIRSSGTSVISLGASFGFINCCVRDGLAMYGLSCAVALHS